MLQTIAAAAAVTALSQPRWLMRMLAARFPDVLFFVETREPVIAVTVDDAPDGDGTHAILDALGEHDARATFFLFASEVRKPRNRKAMQRMVDEGHELGNHLMREEAAVRLSHREFTRQLRASHRILSDFAEPTWFRPGSAWFTSRMLAVLRDHGYRCALGSIYPYDGRLPSARFSRLFITFRAHPGGVIVLHDRGKRGPRTARVLSSMLPLLRRSGYDVGTLSDLVRFE